MKKKSVTKFKIKLVTKLFTYFLKYLNRYFI